MSAEDQIKSYFERWQYLEQRKKAVADDLKELFAETKNEGFENKALRIAFNTKAKAETETAADRELAAVVDIYLSALDAPSRASRAYARENITKSDALPARRPAAGTVSSRDPAANGGAVEPGGSSDLNQHGRTAA